MELSDPNHHTEGDFPLPQILLERAERRSHPIGPVGRLHALVDYLPADISGILKDLSNSQFLHPQPA